METRLDKELRGDGKKLNQGWDLPQKITEGHLFFGDFLLSTKNHLGLYVWNFFQAC